MVSLPKNNYTELAYRDPIAELEDAPVNPNRRPFKLRPHQREALGRWIAITKRHGCFLLADDMGLGKTAVAVARIKLKLDEAKAKGTRVRFLIVVPPTLVSGWKREFRRCPSIKVLEYHKGPQRAFSKNQMEAYDVIITTYDIVKNQYNELKGLQRDFQDIQYGNQARVEQAERVRLSGMKGKRKHAWRLRTKRVSAPLMAIDFEEQILDEAHAIKNYKIAKAYSMGQVRAKYKAAITGTSLQNGYWDLYALFRYMRLKPFGQHNFFKMCFINKTKKRGMMKARLDTDCEFVLASILHAVQCRRVRSDVFLGEAMTGIKHYIGCTIKMELSEEAQQTQEATRRLWDPAGTIQQMHQQAAEADLERPARKPGRGKKAAKKAAKKEDMDEEDEEKAEEDRLFKLIHEAKVNCIHPMLLQAKYSESGGTELEGRSEIKHNAHMLFKKPDHDVDVNVDSATAQDEAAEYRMAAEYAEDEPNSKAFNEKKRAQFEKNRQEFKQRIRQDDNWKSDKMVAILAIVDYIQDKVENECAGMTEAGRKEHRSKNKIIIFGEYVAGLDIVETALLKELGLSVLRFDGTCSHAERDQVRIRFEEKWLGRDGDEYDRDMSDPNIEPDNARILLATSKAAAEGLTLIHARYVIIIQPHWNPYVIEQCIGRVVRLGQEGEVIVFRTAMKRSIEGKIDAIAAAKRAKVSGIQDDEALRGVTTRLQAWGQVWFKRVVCIDTSYLCCSKLTLLLA